MGIQSETLDLPSKVAVGDALIASGAPIACCGFGDGAGEAVLANARSALATAGVELTSVVIPWWLALVTRSPLYKEEGSGDA